MLEGALGGDGEQPGGGGRVGGAEQVDQLAGLPHVVGALGGLPGLLVEAVGVQRGSERALGRAEFAQQEVRGGQRDPAGEGRAGGPPQVQVGAQQQGVVVQHLLEVRHHPVGVHRVPGEAAAELVVDAAAGHRPAGAHGHLQRRLRTGPGVVAQQELQHHGRRELGRAAEAAPALVEVPAETHQRLVQVRLAGRVVGAGRVDGGPLGQVGPDPPGDLPDLLPAVPPGGLHALQHLPERRHPVPGLRREVGTEVERLLVGSEEHRHRPAALPGRGLHRLHVHGVDVRPLLPVHLDRHEPLVEVLGEPGVLEALVRHDMAPVAGRVTDGQQHRHAAALRLREGLGAPGPPVDGVVGVLEQVRRGRVRETVRHASILAHPALGARQVRPVRTSN